MNHEEQTIILHNERPSLIKYLRRLGCSYQNAEDIIQNLHIKILEKRYNVNDKNYFYNAVKHRYYDLVKKRKYEKLTNNYFIFEEGIVAEKKEKYEENTILLNAISSLSNKAKIAVKLYYWHKKTKKEIAEYLGIGESRVNNMIQKSKEKIRKYLVENKIND